MDIKSANIEPFYLKGGRSLRNGLLYCQHSQPLNNDGWDALEIWWTQQERIRTITEIPFSVPLLQLEEPFPYQILSDKAKHLQKLGMNTYRISQALGVDSKTIKKALRWVEDDV